ncbi:SCO family protein [Alysiella filiformis]|uniref:Protein SCO1/2 n=1 Tax=Alysiella filiformis DSM 16848 TaxID=1120981 RepID=A0A286EIG8_9NEIS|nr:SCO family protein [Alysiella filiformis]QMT31956.1 SCO family protein [Alysiella filiformis]UBQ57136.1 SCO family protein [Alysiella filiformis DSM 16848]SOD70750.1 protein SCO1/2 [Alysiella filiformis DSM 16848]
MQWRLLCLAVCLLTACQPESVSPQKSASPAVSAARLPSDVAGSDVRQEKMGGDFTLSNALGQAFALSSLKGKVVLLAFGFTHCPDVCPSELLVYSEALKQLGTQADDVAVVFVSIDPQRDTPDLIGRYVQQFHPKFIGLTATGSQDLESVKKQYRIVAAKTEVKSATAYNMDHTSGAYILDKQGKVVLFEPYGLNATQIAGDLRSVLKGFEK